MAWAFACSACISARQLFPGAPRDGEAGDSGWREGFCRRVIRVFIVAASPLIRAGLQSMLADSRVDVVEAPRILKPSPVSSSTLNPMLFLVEIAADAHEELLNALRTQKLHGNIQSSCCRSSLGRIGFRRPSCGSACCPAPDVYSGATPGCSRSRCGGTVVVHPSRGERRSSCASLRCPRLSANWRGVNARVSAKCFR